MIHEKSKTGFRPWAPGDIPRLAELANDPDIARNLRDGFPYPYTIQDAEDFITMCLDMPQQSLYALTYAGEVAGGIGFVPGHDVHRISAEIGYWLGKEYWGRGIMTAAVRSFSEFVFATTDIIHLHAGIFSTNPASARVLEKCGYRFVGTMRDCAVKRGKIIGLNQYELTKPQLQRADIP